MRDVASRCREQRRLGCTLAVAIAVALAADRSESAPRATESVAHAAAALSEAPRGSRAAPSGNSLVVDNCNDSGPGSLRAALLQTADVPVIDLDALACSTITLTTGALVVMQATGMMHVQRTPAIVDGREVPTLTIDGSGIDRVFEHRQGAALALRGLDIRNGTYHGTNGGCIYEDGTLALDAVTVEHCALYGPTGGGALGGGVYVKGDAYITASTISANYASADQGYTNGGGLCVAGNLRMSYTSVVGNEAFIDSIGGGIATLGGTIIRNSLIASNSADLAGAIAMLGTGTSALTIAQSTITMNSAKSEAGIVAGNRLYLYNSTVSGNIAERDDVAAGVQMASGSALVLYSSIVANNTGASSDLDIGTDVAVIGGHNLVTQTSPLLPPDTVHVDPKLEPLAYHGGQTMTLALLPASPAIDAGSNTFGNLCDQRGARLDGLGAQFIFPRVVGASADIGAYELGADDKLFVDGFDADEAFSPCYPI